MSKYPSWRKSLIAVTTLAAAVILGRFAMSAVSDGSTVPDPAIPKIYGISDNGLLWQKPGEQAAQLAAMRSIGITSMRVDADWGLTQPRGPNSYDWSRLDQEIRSIRDAGMSVDLVIDGCPKWAALHKTVTPKGFEFTQPASTRQFALWAGTAAKRYSQQGVTYFEIWNEPNIVHFWHPKPSPAAYTADLKAAYAAIKAVDPSAYIIAGGLAPAATDGTNYNPTAFLKLMYADGAKGSFNALAYHPYSYPTLPSTYEPRSVWSQMAETRPSIRSVMAANGDSGRPVWITELGAPSVSNSGTDVARLQRTWVSQALTYAGQQNWIGAVYIYTWQDSSPHPIRGASFGLLTANGSRKPVFSAVVSALGTK